MKQRIIAGFLGGLGFLLLIINGGFLFELLIAVLISIGTWEYQRLARASGLETSFGLIWGLSLAYFLTQVLAIRLQWLFLIEKSIGCFLFLVFLGSFFTHRAQLEKGKFLSSVGANLFGMVYPGILLTYIILIRGLPSPLGWQLLVFFFFIIWANDTGAFFIGSFLGKTPLSPRISPHKTVEGAVGGVLLGALVGALGGKVLNLPWSVILVSLFIGITGQIGDLFESLLKRGAGLKDSGQIIPGHGGILDRFDSSLFSLPILYFLVEFFL